MLRYLIGFAFRSTGTSLPLATFVSNLSACLIFALFVFFTNQRFNASSDVRLFILTGICGGLSTFSTFGYETFLLLQQGMVLWGLFNIVASVVFSLLVFQLIK